MDYTVYVALLAALLPLVQGRNRLIDLTKETIPCTMPDPMPAHLNFVVHDNTMFGIRAWFWCRPRNYTLIGGQGASCRDNEWHPNKENVARTPICAASGCKSLPLEDAEVWHVEYDDAMIHVRCQMGYKMDGYWSRTIVCDGNQWNDTSPICTKVTANDSLNITMTHEEWLDQSDRSCWTPLQGSPFIHPPNVEHTRFETRRDWSWKLRRYVLYTRYHCSRHYGFEGMWDMYCRHGRWLGQEHICEKNLSKKPHVHKHHPIQQTPFTKPFMTASASVSSTKSKSL